MGSYTELKVKIKLREDAPFYVDTMIKGMITDDEVCDDVLEHSQDSNQQAIFAHELFRCARWKYMLIASNANEECHYSYLDRVLDTHSEFKNYDQEVQKFAAWIKPYLDPDYPNSITYRYEDWDIYLDYPSKHLTQGWHNAIGEIKQSIALPDRPKNPYVGIDNNLTLAWSRGFQTKKAPRWNSPCAGAYYEGMQAYVTYSAAVKETKAANPEHT